MKPFKICEYCQCALDPGEKCDCVGARRARAEDDRHVKRKEELNVENHCEPVRRMDC